MAWFGGEPGLFSASPVLIVGMVWSRVSFAGTALRVISPNDSRPHSQTQKRSAPLFPLVVRVWCRLIFVSFDGQAELLIEPAPQINELAAGTAERKNLALFPNEWHTTQAAFCVGVSGTCRFVSVWIIVHLPITFYGRLFMGGY